MKITEVVKGLSAKTKFIVILTVEFVAIAILLTLIFFAGKKSFDVTFDLDGGTLISGDTEQRVSQGQSAHPPVAVKEGHYLLGWQGSYKGVTSDRYIKAIWEYETSPGIEYSSSENMTYCEIMGSYPDISGEIYIGAYHNEKIVLGIKSGAFKNNKRITAVHLLDGILRIEDEVFADCKSLTEIDIPSTVLTLGDGVFRGCVSLESITLPEGLEFIGAEAFAGCESLRSITIPYTVSEIGEGAFEGCTSLEEIIFAEGEMIVSPESDEHKAWNPLAPDDDEPLTVKIPQRIEAIGALTFAGCESLLSIEIPRSVLEIASDAFSGCTKLTVALPFEEGEIPSGYAEGWDADVLKIIFASETDEAS